MVNSLSNISLHDSSLTSLVHQILVTPEFHNVSLVEYNDEVGLLDGNEALGNGDAGSALSSRFQGLYHYFLTLTVKGRGLGTRNYESRDFKVA